MKRRTWMLAALVVLALALAYLGAGYMIYSKLAPVTYGGGEDADNTPARFHMDLDEWPDFDAAPYFMPDYEGVRFPSRQSDIDLAGWYVPGNADAPAIVVTHGVNGCKCQPNVLLVAGMLHRHGFNVLLFDLRDHGESELEDGRAALGNDEYLDVLGAWDWLQASKGFAPERIGVYGQSLGAATTLIAFSEEPQAAALFVDSPYAHLDVLINEELTRNDYPTFLAPAALLAARLVSGDDLLAHGPEEAILRAGGRPIYIVHGTGDTRVNVHHTRDLVSLAETVGADVSVWLPEGVDHVDAEEALPDEYESRLVAFFERALGD
jgi:dipeptidyl aminopeptidase/acylaminoacyl peptidase